MSPNEQIELLTLKMLTILQDTENGAFIQMSDLTELRSHIDAIESLFITMGVK